MHDGGRSPGCSSGWLQPHLLPLCFGEGPSLYVEDAALQQPAPMTFSPALSLGHLLIYLALLIYFPITLCNKLQLISLASCTWAGLIASNTKELHKIL